MNVLSLHMVWFMIWGFDIIFSMYWSDIDINSFKKVF